MENKNKITVARAEVTLTQDGDCCEGDDVQVLRIGADDGGGGWFWTIKTERWAFDSVEELTHQLKQVISRLENMKIEVQDDIPVEGVEDE